MNIGRILPGIAILSGRIFVCGGEVDSQILANGEVSRTQAYIHAVSGSGSGVWCLSDLWIWEGKKTNIRDLG